MLRLCVRGIEWTATMWRCRVIQTRYARRHKLWRGWRVDANRRQVENGFLHFGGTTPPLLKDRRKGLHYHLLKGGGNIGAKRAQRWERENARLIVGGIMTSQDTEQRGTKREQVATRLGHTMQLFGGRVPYRHDDG